MFDKLSGKIGFTVTEIKVLLFLTAVFTAGLLYRAYNTDYERPDYKNFDYTSEERLFEQSDDAKDKETAGLSDDKYIDSKQEVLDFNTSNFHKKEAEKLPGEKTININTVGIEDLVRLPGIGEKTAQKIIDFRINKGRFANLEELMQVKGIGKTRFNNIEKFLYIDHSNFFKAPEEK